MKKTFTYLRTLLVGLMAVTATGNAWADDKTVVKYSFDDATSPSLTAGSRVGFEYDKTSVITSTKFLNAYNNTNGDPGASTVSLGSTDLSGETWTLSFEWAACGGCNSKPDHTTLKAGDATLFDLSGNSNWNTTVTIIYTGSDGSKTLPVPGCDKSNRWTAAVGDQYNTTTYWHHIVVTGSAEGVKMTITNSSTGAAVVEDVVLSETNVNPTSLIIEPSCGGGIGIDALSLTYEPAAAPAKEPATVTTAPTGAAVVGVGKETALVSGGEAEGGTLMYAVTTTNTKPTSTDGFSATVPTAQTITASGKVYVWYYVKGDDTHSDSEIAATPIEVPVADIVWDATNVFNSSHQDDMAITWIPNPLTYEGITISVSGEEGSTFVAYDPSSQTGFLICYGDEGDSFTFTAPSGMKFCKIEIINNDESTVFDDYGDWTRDETGKKFVWSGTAANAVTLGTVYTVASNLNSIAFYLSE